MECGISSKPDGSEYEAVRIKYVPDVSWEGWAEEYSDTALKLEKWDVEELADNDGDEFDCEEREKKEEYSDEATYLNLKNRDLSALMKARKLPYSGTECVLIGIEDFTEPIAIFEALTREDSKEESEGSKEKNIVAFGQL
jgi:hypothetical protein